VPNVLRDGHDLASLAALHPHVVGPARGGRVRGRRSWSLLSAFADSSPGEAREDAGGVPAPPSRSAAP
jgi:hypothetical protein